MTETDLSAAADLLLDARRTGAWLTELPESARPGSLDEAYAIQDLLVRRKGGAAGWKVGAPSPTAEPIRGALASDTIHESPARLPATSFNVIGAEAELVYRFASPLPLRDRPYDLEEVLAAVGSVHAAIEIADTRYKVWKSVDQFSQIADQTSHGVLVVGTGKTDWRGIEPVNEPVTLWVDDRREFETIGGNSAGDPRRMLLWLANVGSRGQGGIKAGDRVTSGSTCGTIFVKAPCRLTAEFPGVGKAVLDIV
ncbi:2-keto-4-pentenoate hydratase [Skermanella sp. TT6]|uniref:2-keto-4-pentenoate hydratase n=1 Tax=Skermanella cutis TaxID=2775420 RepID=UPI001FFE3422|nr:2-keto-4-pentenoate hydratase [Skermanella sp. TT6]